MARLTYNGFIAYCVANTITPDRTRGALVNAAWLGLEIYTVAELSLKAKAKRIQEVVRTTYPWLTPAYWKEEPHNGSSTAGEDQARQAQLAFIDEDGNEVAMDGESAGRDSKLMILTQPSSTVPYISVTDVGLDSPSRRFGCSDGPRIDDKDKLGYKLLACTVSCNTTDTIWQIVLTDGSTYSYYTLGTLILSKPFLKMFGKRHMSSKKTRDEFLKCVSSDDYTVKLIDNRVNTIEWSGPGNAIELHSCGPVLVSLFHKEKPVDECGESGKGEETEEVVVDDTNEGNEDNGHTPTPTPTPTTNAETTDKTI